MSQRPLILARRISAVLCVVTVLMWARSYFRFDRAGWYSVHRPPPAWTASVQQLYSIHGMLSWDRSIYRFSAGRAPPAEFQIRRIGWIGATRATGPTRMGYPQGGPLGVLGIGTWRGKGGDTRATYRTVAIMVPYWLPFVLTVVLPGVPLVRKLRRRWRRLIAPGHCPVCGYDLRATPHRCPECGTAGTMG